MFKLIKMNLYRMIHTKSLIIMLALTVIFGWASACLFYEESDYSVSDYSNEDNNSAGEDLMSGFSDGYNEARAEAEGETTETTEEVIVLGFASTDEVVSDASLTNAFMLATSDIGSCLPLLLIGIGAVLFVGAERKFGFTKNLVSHNVSKTTVYMAKSLAYSVYALAIMLGYLFSMLITLMILYGKEMDYSMEAFPEFAKYFGLHFLLTVAYSSGLILLNTVTKSTALSVTACSLTTTGFIPTLLLMPLENKFDIELIKYTICQNMINVNFHATDNMIMLALGVGIVTLLVYNILGNVWVAKRDVV